MAYAAPRTWSSGEIPTAAQFNQDIRDNAAFLANPPACRVYHNTTQSITDNAITTVAFNSERFDTDTMHSTVTNNSRITISTAGLYLVTFVGEFVNAADYSFIYGDLVLNGTTIISVYREDTSARNDGKSVLLSTVYKFAAADFITARVYQDNTANAARNLQSTANYTPEFSAVWLGLG